MQKYAYDVCLRGGGNLKASLTRVFSLAKNEQAMTQKDNCGECDLGFNPHQEHYRQVILPSVLSSPDGEGYGINSITNLSPYRPIALTPLAKAAFTMAEILLSLTIIGVVAAITLPSLTGNINERTWNTQRKALYSRISQAVSLMPSVRGYGTLNSNGGVIANGHDDGNRLEISSDDATETFLSAGLAKVFKLNNICDNQHLADCGLPNQIKNMMGSNIELSTLRKIEDLIPTINEWGSGGRGMYSIHIDNAAFETANGESVLVFYNPLCKDKATAGADRGSMNPEDNNLAPELVMCLNLLYDLNGKKGPNTVGKDMGFMSVFYPNDPIVVAPLPQAHNVGVTTTANASNLCSQQNDDYRLPNMEEMMSISLNYKFVDFDFKNSSVFATSSRAANGFFLKLSYASDGTLLWWSGDSVSVRCVKR